MGPRTIILTDQRAIVEFISFLNAHEKGAGRILRSFWNGQREDMTAGVAKRIIENGHSIPQDVIDSWARDIKDFVGRKMVDIYQDALEFSGSRMAGRINRSRKQEFEFNKVSSNILAWMNEHGGELIVQLTAGQYKTINALLQHQVFQGITSPYVMAQRLKPLIPLLKRDALAVTKLYGELTRAGLGQEVIARQTAKYADYLLRNRAMLIARTELSGAYHEGQLQSVRQAVESGYVDGEPRKTWLCGPDPCPDCEEVDGEEVGLEDVFSNGYDSPPAHPGCRCDVVYSIRR